MVVVILAGIYSPLMVFYKKTLNVARLSIAERAQAVGMIRAGTPIRQERFTETTRSTETQDKEYVRTTGVKGAVLATNNICDDDENICSATEQDKGAVLATNYNKVDDKIIIRKASLQDKEAVLSINNNIYDGQDYLEAYYDHFVRDPDITPRVLERNGEIISFNAGHLVDDGQTIVIRAGRTKPKHSGQGLYLRLLEHVIKSTRARVLVFHKPICMKNHTQVERQVYYEFTVLPTQLNIDLDMRKDVESVAEQSEEQLRVLLSSEMYNSYLFPCGRLVLNWVSIQPTISNISKWTTNAEGKTTIFSDVAYKGDKPVGLLSISTIYPCKTPGHVIAIFIYGSEFASLESHVLLHLKALCDTVTMETLVNLNFESDIDISHVQISLTNLNMSKTEVSQLKPITCVVNKRNL